jgi:hypothetical protein
VIWGGLNGLFLVFERGGSKTTQRRSSFIAWAMTFVLVTFAWIFFRAATVADALVVIKGLPRGWGSLTTMDSVRGLLRSMWTGPGRFVTTFAALGVLIGADLYARSNGRDPVDLVRSLRTPVRWSLYYAVAAALVVFGQYGQQQFIYFQF